MQACGTARCNRKYYPKDIALKDSGQDRGWSDYRSSPPLVACVWKDRRIINFLSTMHKAEGSSTVLRTVVRDGHVTRESLICPPLLPDYQTYMRGVDRGDQLMGYYSLARRLKKWWKRVFAYVIEVAALNGYIVYKAGLPSSESCKYDYMKYRIDLAEDLIGSFSSRPLAMGRPRSVGHQQVLRLDTSKNHLPDIDSGVHQCVVCCKIRDVRKLTRSQMRHETKVKCSVCDVNLCLTSGRNCFKKYHTFVNYWL